MTVTIVTFLILGAFAAGGLYGVHRDSSVKRIRENALVTP